MSPSSRRLLRATAPPVVARIKGRASVLTNNADLAPHCCTVRFCGSTTRPMPADIDALPDELLALVLLEWFRSSEQPAGEWHRYKFDYITSQSAGERDWLLHQRLRRVPFQASAVCRRWRALALQTPALWRHIRLDFDRLPRMETLETLVSRSGAVPLRVVLDNAGCSINDRGAQDFWPLVHRVVGRAETLVVASIYDDCTPDPELFAALAQPNAALVNFSITVDLDRGPPYPQFSLPLSAPRLQCLRWTGPDLHFGDFHVAFPALQEAFIRCETLHVSQLRSWFTHMPNLRKMTLSGVNPIAVLDAGTHPRASHSVALSSSLSELVVCNKLVPALVTPSVPPFSMLRRLKVTYPHFRADPALLDLLRQCAESLESVDLELRPDKDIQRLIASLPALKTMRLPASDETMAFLSGHAQSLVAHRVEDIFIVGVRPGLYHRLRAKIESISESLRNSGSSGSLRLVDDYAKVVVRIVVDTTR